MADVTRMRDVTLSIGGRKVGLCRKAEIHHEWDAIQFPIYRDSPTTRTIRATEKIKVVLEKVYQEKQDFVGNFASGGQTITLATSSETHTITNAQIVHYKLDGNSDGELLESVILYAESHS